VTHNVFPPAVPERLLAMVSELPGKKFVDLLWSPNMEKDVAGYQIYRRQADGKVERINSAPITMLSFQDTNVAAGSKYFYSISAVDIRGNESPRSSEVAVGLP
jgi:fibronectin type 3 domain-containing protein